MYTLTKAERETHISWDMETRTASIDTADPVVIRKLDRLVEECPEAYRLISADTLFGIKRFMVPARYVKFGKPASDAQREANRRKSQFCAK